jgi:hypothetical protein
MHSAEDEGGGPIAIMLWAGSAEAEDEQGLLIRSFSPTIQFSRWLVMNSMLVTYLPATSVLE